MAMRRTKAAPLKEGNKVLGNREPYDVACVTSASRYTEAHLRWLLISYSVPTQPSALRVSSWRALKQAGAMLLGPGLYALPQSDPHKRVLTELTARIVAGGGTAIMLNAEALTEGDERALTLKYEGARHDEYQQVLKSARKFCAHVEQEERDSDYRFAEVESLEEELGKVRRQLALVRGRDSLNLPIAIDAEAAVAAAAARLQQYVDNAYQAEHGE